MGLSEILENQTDLQRRIWAIVPGTVQWEDLTNRERCEMLAKHVSYLQTEAGEFLNELPYYKNWKVYEDHDDLEDYSNWDAMWEEYLDIFLFYLNGLILMGKSAQDLEDKYFEKATKVDRREHDRRGL